VSLRHDSEILRQTSFFAGIEPSRLKLLAFVSERVVFDPGQILLAQGEPADAAYLIIEGCTEVFFETGEGEAVKLATIGPRETVGEVGILCGTPRTATVRARERVVALRITKAVFEQMVRDCPDMALSIMRVLARRLDAMNRQVLAALAERTRTGNRPE
jgi:CRP-like cAMP-binding protein